MRGTRVWGGLNNTTIQRIILIWYKTCILGSLNCIYLFSFFFWSNFVRNQHINDCNGEKKKNRNTGCENFVRCGCGDYLNDDAIRNENVSTMRTTPEIWICFSTGKKKKDKGFENRYSSPIPFGSPLLGDASSPSSQGLSIASTAFSFLIRGVLRSVPPDKCLYAIPITFFSTHHLKVCAFNTQDKTAVILA